MNNEELKKLFELLIEAKKDPRFDTVRSQVVAVRDRALSTMKEAAA